MRTRESEESNKESLWRTLPRRLNLNNLTFHLPFDKVEYEPEQFPGLIYRLDYPKVVCLIFGSGKMVITGARAKDQILEAVQFIQDELADLPDYRPCNRVLTVTLICSISIGDV